MIIVNMVKAKEIAHQHRRVARQAEFAPLDILVTIPAQAQQAEVKRQEIRDKYANIQSAINEAKTTSELKSLLTSVD